MPQLDTAMYPTQLFWLVVTFGILYLVLARIALPGIRKLLDERQQRIDDNLARAEKLKGEAEAAVAAYEKAMAEARAQARDILRDAAERIAREADARQKALAAKLAEQIKAGEAGIARAKAQALAEVRGVAAGLAQSTVDRLADMRIDEGAAARAVAAALDAPGKERG